MLASFFYGYDQYLAEQLKQNKTVCFESWFKGLQSVVISIHYFGSGEMLNIMVVGALIEATDYSIMEADGENA